MLTRRLALGAALAAASFAGAAHAQSWRSAYPELVFAVIPAENASGVTERYGPFIEYLSKELGAKVTLRIANDYAAVIEGQRNGSIHLAGYGPASYARAVVTGVKVDADLTLARVFVDKCLELLLQDKLDTATASMAKYWCSDLQNKVIDECVQLFGGYGYMWEYPVARAWADARVQRIYGGTNEIMKEVISRSLGLGARK